jgi:hypothetical protein
MRAKFIRTLWGVTAPLHEYLPLLAARGFAGIETSPLFHTPQDLMEILDHLKPEELPLRKVPLQFILLVLTSGETVHQHLQSIRDQINTCLSLTINPIKVNIHGGCDYWNWGLVVDYFEGFQLIIAEYPTLLLMHETHRSRMMYSPWATHKILIAYPDLRITADLSHWVVVAERHLFTNEFSECMELIYRNTSHIHARPCSPQFIQLSEPSDPYFIEDVEAFKTYWRNILKEQKLLGINEITVDPEFGPPPYSLVKHHSNGVMIRDLESCVDDVKEIIEKICITLDE